MLIQYPFQFFTITHDFYTDALIMKFSSTWALGQMWALRPTRGLELQLGVARAHRRDAGLSWRIPESIEDQLVARGVTSSCGSG
eukprot:COSAG02_NODE_433_length_22435_cov_151.224078_12_plen_84_part_00